MYSKRSSFVKKRTTRQHFLFFTFCVVRNFCWYYSKYITCEFLKSDVRKFFSTTFSKYVEFFKVDGEKKVSVLFASTNDIPRRFIQEVPPNKNTRIIMWYFRNKIVHKIRVIFWLPFSSCSLNFRRIIITAQGTLWPNFFFFFFLV